MIWLNSSVSGAIMSALLGFSVIRLSLCVELGGFIEQQACEYLADFHGS
jgi:hypothetical protein